MNVDEKMVEQIVAQVMQKLQPADDQSKPAAAAPKTTVTQDLLLNEAVLTAELLELRVNGAARIGIGLKTVLTPSARDFLASRNIEWHRQAADGSGTKPKAQFRAILIGSQPNVDAVLGELARSGEGCWQTETVNSAGEAVSAAASALCNRTAAGVIVLGKGAEAVACRANRNWYVRAGVAYGVQCVDGLRKQIGVNLITVNPRSRNHMELRNILRSFASAGVPRPPAAWQD